MLRHLQIQNKKAIESVRHGHAPDTARNRWTEEEYMSILKERNRVGFNHFIKMADTFVSDIIISSLPTPSDQCSAEVLHQAFLTHQQGQAALTTGCCPVPFKHKFII